MLGILGAGQLGRMLAASAWKLGIDTAFYTDKPDDCALPLGNKNIVSNFSDTESLDKFASYTKFVTFEFENIPVGAVKHFPNSAPGANCLEVASNRLKEKKLFESVGAKTAPYKELKSAEDLSGFETGSVIKTVSGGYDGKGQWKVSEGLEKVPFGKDLMVEKLINLETEISVLLARDHFGSIYCYEPTENRHENHILRYSRFPFEGCIGKEAKEVAKRIAEKLDYIGVLCVEFFVSKEGELLANEIAPRVHNSGHHTIESCSVSQFEQHVRAVFGLPIVTDVSYQKAEMVNILGDCSFDNLYKLQGSLHMYGKKEQRIGRKMGHITSLSGNGLELERSLYANT